MSEILEYTRSYIWLQIQESRAWTERAVLALYERQTADEKSAGSTVHHNAAGYNAFDAPFMTSLAEQLKQGRHLSNKQLAAARKVLRKYTGQLAKIAKANQVQA